MAVFAGVVALTSRFCVAVVARTHEFADDDGAVAITGTLTTLASALETLDVAISRWVIYRGLLGTHPSTGPPILSDTST